MTLPEHVTSHFIQQFGRTPEILVRAPGRVNLIGEHTDYNDGFVLPMAINRAVWIALSPRPDQEILIHSLDFPQPARFSLSALHPGQEGWVEYVKGMAWALAARHVLTGWEGVLASNVPVGAGLSSSAALELAIGRAFQAVSGWEWDGKETALLAQKCENQFVGVKTGIMDQMITALGRSGHAMQLDCRTLETEHVPLPGGCAVIVLDTATRRGLVGSAYDERVAQCQEAAHHFGVRALRDVSPETLQAQAKELAPLTLHRARHVITENARTLEAVEAMYSGNAPKLGELMDASHTSLRDDYDVSSLELNVIVESARKQQGCLGARMTGAGFGGCAVALVESSHVETFVAQTSQDYTQKTGLTPKVYVCHPANGAEVVKP